MTEDGMVGWHHQLNGHEFEKTPRDSEGQGTLVCHSLQGHKELDMTERLHFSLCSTLAFPVLHYLWEFSQTHVH